MCRKFRTLLIAESANPEWSSVPLVGWSLSYALRGLTDAHIVTQIRNREAFLRAGLIEGSDFTVIDSEYVAAPFWKLADHLRGGAGKGWTTMTAISSLSYYVFEMEVWRLFGARIKTKEFDIVHRITPLSPTSQSFISRRLAKSGVPFVIGPLNGGLPWPKNFRDRQHAEKEWLSYARFLYKWMPYYTSTQKYSSAIIVGSRHTYDEIPEWAKYKTVYIPENGVDPKRFNCPRTRTAGIPLKAAFIGRLVPYKGADIFLDAVAEYLVQGKLEIVIIGEGPQRPVLDEMVEQLGVKKSVRFLGSLPHQEVQDHLRQCDFLALPSVREFGGAVVLESMALGVMPIVANYGGPSELVDDNTGIRINFSDRQSLKNGINNIVMKLIDNPSIIDERGARGIDKISSKFTWEQKASQIYDVYESIISGKKDLRYINPFALK